MKCTRFNDDCPDAGPCRMSRPVGTTRRQGKGDEQSPSKLILGIPVCALLTGGTVMAIIAAIQGSLWWLVVPVVAALGLALILGRPYRRDEQLALILALHELPDADAVDRELLDPVAWENALWVDLDDPRWACDLERDTGLDEGERR